MSTGVWALWGWGNGGGFVGGWVYGGWVRRGWIYREEERPSPTLWSIPWGGSARLSRSAPIRGCGDDARWDNLEVKQGPADSWGGWGLSALRSLNWNRAGEWEERWQLGHAGASGLRAPSLRTRPGLLRAGGGGKAPGLLPSSSRFPPPQMPTALQHPTYCPQIPSGLLP